MTPSSVAGFLLLNHSCPRSIVQSVHQIELYLTQLSSGYGLRNANRVLEQLEDLRAAVMNQSIEQILARGLHEFLDWVQLQFIGLAASQSGGPAQASRPFRLQIDPADLPAIWDADFLYGSRELSDEDTYVLCEINVSSVLPFPEPAPTPATPS